MKRIQIVRGRAGRLSRTWSCARLPAALCRSGRATTCPRVRLAHHAPQHANPDKEPPCSLLPPSPAKLPATVTVTSSPAPTATGCVAV
jgi:hypothetical protein